MDLNQPKILCRQCVLCGDEFVFYSGSPSTTRMDVDTKRLFSIFLRCVSSNSDDDEVDSDIIDSWDSNLANFGNDVDDGFAFCNACQTALIQWDKLYESRVAITQNLNRLKLTIYDKILNNSKTDKSDKLGRKNRADHGVNRSQSLLLLLQKIQRVKDQICRQFNPRVNLKEISYGEISESSENFRGFDEDGEFETFKNEIIHYSDDDDRNNAGHGDDGDSEMASGKTTGDDDEGEDDLEIKSDQGSADDDDQQPGKRVHLKAKRGSEPKQTNRKGVKSYEIVTIGPNEWMYAGKCRITFNSEEQRYHCGLCSTVNSRKYGLMRHIRNMHINGKRATKADAVRSSFHQKNSSGFDEDEEFEAFENELIRTGDDENGNNAGHSDDDDWEMASECSSDDDDEREDDLEINSGRRSAHDHDQQLGERFNLETKRDEPGKTNRKGVKAYEIVTIGPNEWIYAGICHIIFNSEEQRYHCGLCSAFNSRKYGLMRHIRNMHIRGKLAKVTKADLVGSSWTPQKHIADVVRSSPTPQKHKAEMLLRPTGDPNEYIYRDRFKVTCKDNEWCCGECGAQWKDRRPLMAHIRSAHMITRTKSRPWLRYDQIAPNEFRCYGNYSFRFDPDQQLYLCSLCDYTSTGTVGVLGHVRGNHCTDEEKQEHRAVQVAPGIYLYGGKYKIVQEEDGRFRCSLCDRTREYLNELYPHFRIDHADVESDAASGAVIAWESSENPRRKEKNDGDDQKPNANLTASVTDAAQKARMASIERRSLKRAMARGWKMQGNGTWVYKDWQLKMEDGKYKCSTCDMVEEDRKRMFLHVQSAHAKESVINPPVRVRPGDEMAELEYMGVAYKYDPTQDKYACSLCSTKLVNRGPLKQHIKSKHVHPEKFVCDICGLEMESRLAFRRHRARHEGPKYACRICNKRFTADCYLRTHLKIHMGEDAKKHQCEFCGKKFYTLKQLKNHRPSHTGEKPFPCDLCGEGFATTFKRREHRKKFHGGLPQKHGWNPMEEGQDVVAPPWVYSIGEDLLTVTEVE